MLFRSVSVALGELRDWCQMDNMAIQRGVDYAKLGMAGSADWSDWPDRWAEAIRRFPLSVRPVAVIYADGEAVAAPEPDQVLAEAQRLGCAAVLVDTFDKSRGGCWMFGRPSGSPGSSLRREVKGCWLW